MQRLGWMLMGLSLGCADRAVDPEGREAESDVEIDDDDDTDVPCDSTEGELSGRILQAWDANETPSPNAYLTATAESDGEAKVIIADEQGHFLEHLPADTYDVIARDHDACSSDVMVIELNACANVVETFRLYCDDGDG